MLLDGNLEFNLYQRAISQTEDLRQTGKNRRLFSFQFERNNAKQWKA